VLGGVKVDGSSITISNVGVITATPYSLPIATSATPGGVIVDVSTVSINNGVITAVPANIRSVAAAMLTGGTQTGISFSYNSSWVKI
jgi:hypothetical protein